MYTGTLIEDLMAAVERAQESSQLSSRDDEQALVLAPMLYEMGQTDHSLLGAA